MTKPRKQQISLDATPFYHCVSRCVRRAFLCGTDKFNGRSYEHRRRQIENDVLRLASVFFIDVAAFAIMSNHYHLVLYVDQDACRSASGKDIVERWHKLFTGPFLHPNNANIYAASPFYSDCPYRCFIDVTNSRQTPKIKLQQLTLNMKCHYLIGQ